jgi:acyl carrier protein
MVSARVTEADVLEAIREIAARELQLAHEILPSHELIGDLELDSITLVAMLASIENQFRVCLPAADTQAIQTVQHIVEQVVQRCREHPS